MRIISKFRDYYDSIQGYGIEENMVYPRNEEETDIGKRFWSDDMFLEVQMHLLANNSWRTWAHDVVTGGIKYNTKIIGFCGKIYPVVHLEHVNIGKPNDELWAYSAAAITDWLSTLEHASKKERRVLVHRFKQTYEKTLPSTRKWFRGSGTSKRPHDFCHATVKKLFDELDKCEGLSELFSELNVPIFVLDKFQKSSYAADCKATLTTHKRLVDFNFQKRIDPFTAYQDIGTFIGGVLGMRAPYMEQIDDISMRDSKGFDDKSFKKAPGKKNRKSKKT